MWKAADNVQHLKNGANPQQLSYIQHSELETSVRHMLTGEPENLSFCRKLAARIILGLRSNDRQFGLCPLAPAFSNLAEKRFFAIRGSHTQLLPFGE